MSHPALAFYLPVGEMSETEQIAGTAYKPIYIGASNSVLTRRSTLLSMSSRHFTISLNN
jgi:hypothetical protein